MNLKTAVISSAKRVYQIYPEYCEVDDLIAQGYLIALEKIKDYDKNRGASLNTYINRVVEYGLHDYVRRCLIKEGTLGGLRVDVEADSDTVDVSRQVEAREGLKVLLEHLSGEKKVVAQMVGEGYSLREIGGWLGISKQRVCQIIQQIRGE